MNRKFAAGLLTALLYAQGLLGFAGVATVLLKDRANAAAAAGEVQPAQATAHRASPLRLDGRA
jgi:hypothetical protein